MPSYNPATEKRPAETWGKGGWVENNLKKLALCPIFALIGLAGGYFLRSDAAIPQVALSAALVLLFFTIHKAIFPARRLFSIGPLFILIVFIYQVFPIIALIMNDYNLGILADYRLYRIPLTVDLLGQVWQIQTYITTGFGFTYLAFTTSRAPSPLVSPPDMKPMFRNILIISGLSYAIAMLILAGDSYADSYVAIQQLPVLVAQILNIIWQLFFISLVGFLILSARDREAQFFFAIIIGVGLFYAISETRTPIILMIFAALIAYDRYWRRLNLVYLSLFAMALLLGFLILGLARADAGLNTLFAQNEFMAIYVTVLDVTVIASSGGANDIGGQLWLSDLMRPIPGQFLPFEKFDASLWYITNFYPRAASAGHGYGFSLAAEAALSGGAIDGLIRAMALGAIVVLVVNKLERKSSIFAQIILIWLFCFVYLSFRDSTFTLVPRFIFQVLPALALIYTYRALTLPASGKFARTDI